MHKFPKTPRLTKALQNDQTNWRSATAVIEEKVDGANSGINFVDGKLTLQSRGHVLVGGPKEKQFTLFKQWANTCKNELFDLLDNRYLIFGEWTYAMHKIFYDNLPHYFLAFDVLDKEDGSFMPSLKRRAFLSNSPIVSVAQIHKAPFKKINNFGQYIGRSNYADVIMEGIYIKIEDDNKVIDRMKMVRPEFEKIKDDNSDWFRKPITPNCLASNIRI